MRKTYIFVVILAALFCIKVRKDIELDDRLARVVTHAKDGSCGYVALYVSDYLTARNEPHEIRLFRTGEWSNVHIFVKHDGKRVDRYGYAPIIDYFSILRTEVITRDQLQQLLAERWRWNKDFDLSDTAILREIAIH